MTLIDFLFKKNLVFSGREARRLANFNVILLNGYHVLPKELEKEIFIGDVVCINTKRNKKEVIVDSI